MNSYYNNKSKQEATASEVSEVRTVAEKIRAAYLETALTSYEDAAANGLCAEGAWEVAVDAMRHLEITDLLQLLAPADHLAADQSSSRLPSGSRR